MMVAIKFKNVCMA